MLTEAQKAEKIKNFNLVHANNQQAPGEAEATKTNAEKILAEKLRRENEIKAEVERVKLEKEHKENGVPNVLPSDDNTQETLKLLTDSTSYMIDSVNQKINPAKQWLASQPTPGGIAAILLFIAFMMLAIIPVNSHGQTRLYLFWNTLVGRTHMKYRETTSTGDSSSTTPIPTSNGQYSVNLTTGQSTQNNALPVSATPLSFQHLNIFGASE